LRPAVAALLLACPALCVAAETFSFDLPEPRLRIVVPDVPQMKMEAHPLAASQPHARFIGSAEGGYTLSVLLPAAGKGMTPRDCAQSLARAIVGRFGLDPKYVVSGQANETTFVLLFPYRVDPVIQFKAFLLSADRGEHCVEVHVSRTVPAADEKDMAEDLARWFEGFRRARIESY